MSAALNRTTFRTSRLLDFASEKELIAQTGHQRTWPLVILKELVDNALDACEEAGDRAGDHGHGRRAAGSPSRTTARASRPTWSRRPRLLGPGLSSREAYVCPTRGAQGNALKTIVAMPFVLDGERGRVEIEARGVSAT